MKNEVTKQIRVYGIVQGVGFRPTVSRHAATHQIRGSVSNKGPYVEIFAQGPEEAVDGFISDIENKPPKRAAILKMNIEPVEEAEDFTEFAIIESEKTKGETFVSPDIAICDECKEEMFDPKNRRYLHPFINCTCCGPRLTILDALPYDRERTSMKEFPMCPDCAKEYYDPATRRYDAQPVCCNECGPEVYLIGREERGRDAIIYTRRTIAEGGISDMIEMVENHVNDEDYTSMDMAAALLKMVIGDSLDRDDDVEEVHFDMYEDDNRMVRLFINVGKKDKIKPANILGAIAGESGMPGKLVGAIDNYTFVEVPAKHADKVLKAMSNAKIKGRSINIEKAQGGRKKKGRRK